MSTLNTKQKESIKFLLDKQQNLLETAISNTSRDASELYENGLMDAKGDLGDEAATETLINIDGASIDHYVSELNDIEETRARITNGEYGICISCGEEITFSRLISYPTAKRCVQCQSQLELNQNKTKT